MVNKLTIKVMIDFFLLYKKGGSFSMATNPWGSVRQILGTPGTVSYENRLNNLYGRNASYGSYGQLPGYFTTSLLPCQGVF